MARVQCVGAICLLAASVFAQTALGATELSGVASAVDEFWETAVMPNLMDFLRIPNLSPNFVDTHTNDEMWKAARHLVEWAHSAGVPGLVAEVVEVLGLSPTVVLEVPATGSEEEVGCVVLYGHYDQQPGSKGWTEGLSSYMPVRKGNKLYGRGSVDDAWALYAMVAIMKVMHDEGIPHGRIFCIVEGSAESGSIDLPAYLDLLKTRIGTPNLVIVMDALGWNYQQLFVTKSVRGMIRGDLEVAVTSKGMHSGLSGGVIPDSFRVMRKLLDRVEDSDTGKIKLPEMHVRIPDLVMAEAQRVARMFDMDRNHAADMVCHSPVPFLKGTEACEAKDATDVLLNNWWRPSLTVIGAEDLPSKGKAGLIIRPKSTLLLSIRLPPTADPEIALTALKKVLETDPPYGAHVTFHGKSTPGFAAPPVAPWLSEATARASRVVFGKPPVPKGIGGSIGTMAMFGQRFPKVQYLVAGVGGPDSKLHGPDEYLNIDYTKKVVTSRACSRFAHT